MSTEDGNSLKYISSKGKQRLKKIQEFFNGKITLKIRSFIIINLVLVGICCGLWLWGMYSRGRDNPDIQSAEQSVEGIEDVQSELTQSNFRLERELESLRRYRNATWIQYERIAPNNKKLSDGIDNAEGVSEQLGNVYDRLEDNNREFGKIIQKYTN